MILIDRCIIINFSGKVNYNMLKNCGLPERVNILSMLSLDIC